VPVPGVDTAVIASFFDSHQSDALGLFNMFSGNAVERLSIISLGIMPYITASIIMELLAATFPTLGQMKKERDGMVKYMQIIRYATIAITIIQAIGVSVGLQSLTGPTGNSAILADQNTFILLAVVSMLAGTMLLMWIGEQITQNGIGNGISLIICRYSIGYPFSYRSSYHYGKYRCYEFLNCISCFSTYLSYCRYYYLCRTW
jgi:preprotein translocase subunit SecY